MDKKFLTVKEAAAILKVNPETIREKLRKGQIPAFKLGKDWRISENNLNNYINKKHVLYNEHGKDDKIEN